MLLLSQKINNNLIYIIIKISNIIKRLYNFLDKDCII